MIAPPLIRVVDAETTSMDDPCEMVELGWTDLHLSDGGWRIDGEPHALLVHPRMPVSFPAQAVHHISFAQAAMEGIDPWDARRIAVYGVDLVATHNWKFDRRFIRTDLPAICTFKGALTVWPNLQGHGNGSIRYELGLCLGDPRAYPAHRAGPDSWITAHILLELLKHRTVEQLIDISGKPVLLRKIGFGEHSGKLFSDIPESYLGWIVNKSKMPDDPDREDVVFTARAELNRRAAAAPARAPEPSPDAWRSQMELC